VKLADPVLVALLVWHDPAADVYPYPVLKKDLPHPRSVGPRGKR